jgi:hypothetical protein
MMSVDNVTNASGASNNFLIKMFVGAAEEVGGRPGQIFNMMDVEVFIKIPLFLTGFYPQKYHVSPK